MGLKKFFKPKPKSQEDFEKNVQDKLEEKNMPTKRQYKQREKQFGDFDQYAKQYSERIQKKKYSPFEKGEEGEDEVDLNAVETDGNSNPYAAFGSASGAASSNTNSNPYGSINSNGNSNPYGNNNSNYNSYNDGNQNGGSNPYGNQASAGAAAAAVGGAVGGAAAFTNNSSFNPYAKNNASEQSRTYTNPYKTQQTQVQEQLPPEELDLNDDTYHDNDTAYNVDLNSDAYQIATEPVYEETEEERLQREEDEEVIQVKDQMRDEKIKTIGSLRNTLQMAREAETSGKNTVGMLGSQSEALMDIESNLALAERQQMIAKDKIAELHHYNRSMFKPGMKNPFTKSRRLREQEEVIKNQHLQTKIEREAQRREMAQSSGRVNNSLNGTDADIQDSVTNKYKREKYRAEAKRYQFENDSEDDEIEMEIAENLDEVAKISGRLKKLAVTQGEELDRQNYRMRDIEEKTDKLDINVHLNTASLSRAK